MTAQAAKVRSCATEKLWNEQLGVFMASTGKPAIVAGVFGCKRRFQQESCGQGCPTKTWCPFNLYRTSGDVARVAQSWLHNLQTTTKFRDPAAPQRRSAIAAGGSSVASDLKAKFCKF